VLVRRRKPRSWQLCAFLAAWFAAVLAIAPSVRCPPPDAAAGIGSIAGAFVAQDDADRGTSTLGLPARTSPLEAALALEANPSEHRVTTGGPRAAPTAAAAMIGEDRPLFQRSAIGTARTPTGPPV
jgi:hypothetical protein